jgi:nucleosome assembly protein 1-like 1
MPDEEKLKEKKDIEGEEEEKDLGEKMDMDFDIGNEFKDQLIPLALEYYMEVIDEDDEEGDSCHSGDGHGHHHHGKDDSDDDEQDNKKTKGKKGGAKKEGGAPAGDQKECKQQ